MASGDFDQSGTQFEDHRFTCRADFFCFPKNMSRSKGRMAGKWYFLAGSENSDFEVCFGVFWWIHKSGFGQIHFPCNFEMSRFIHVSRVNEHREGVASEHSIRENINLVEFLPHTLLVPITYIMSTKHWNPTINKIL